MQPVNFIKRLRRLIYMLWARYNPQRWLRRLHIEIWPFVDRYILEDNTQVTIYTAHPESFSSYQPVRVLLGEPRQRHVTVSLVITARNEVENVRRLFASVLSQTRLPDEIIICDTGSQDGTVELLREFVSQSSVPVEIITEREANIARGRNVAIACARGPIIAVTDFGCEPEPVWLENLVAPFEIDPEVQVSAGRYKAIDRSGRPARWWSTPALAKINPQNYLPPSVSVAFTKEAWEGVGGYPEWLTLTGEDTYFDLELKRSTSRWAFVPEAIVWWEAPQTMRGCWRKSYVWSTGNGEVGTSARAYRWVALKIGFLVVSPLVLLLLGLLGMFIGSAGLVILALLLSTVWLGLISVCYRKGGPLVAGLWLEIATDIAQLMGYLKGASRRNVVDRFRYKTLKGIFFIISGVPIDDTGGGARSTQIALELLRRQYMVVFLNKYPKYESVDVDITIRHPNLITSPLKNFSLDLFTRQYGDLPNGKPVGVLVELPLGECIPVLQGLRARGARIIYDLMDNWDSTLGAKWYSLDIEREIIACADRLIATAPVLAEHLKQVSDRSVMILPNAVNLRLFDYRREYLRPADLPSAEWTISYIGALWGEWFDWQLLVNIAKRYPSASVVVIGDYQGQCPESVSNLHFLGLRPQKDLPPYLAHTEVAIIPWKSNEISRATSPLKVYEYLAMHKPVVVPDLPLLADLPYVFRSVDQEGFLQNIDRARNIQVGGEALDRFLVQNSWQTRVSQIVDIINPCV